MEKKINFYTNVKHLFVFLVFSHITVLRNICHNSLSNANIIDDAKNILPCKLLRSIKLAL